MSEPGTDNGFPSLYPALDDLYATFDPSAGSENRRSSRRDVRLPLLSGEADFDSTMTNTLKVASWGAGRDSGVHARMVACDAVEVPATSGRG
jgi:hypothetical protein